jgi:hypothetical protein
MLESINIGVWMTGRKLFGPIESCFEIGKIPWQI